MRRDDSGNHRSELLVWAAVLLVVLVIAALRARLLSMPLERDEGEYAYMGQLMLRGIPPFKLAYTLKLPGTAFAYAFVMAIFGQTPTAVHLGLLIVNTATIILVFLLGRKLLGASAGVVACVTYAVMSLSNSVLGLAAHATHFVVFFAIAGAFVILKAIESGRLLHFFLGGLLFGFAFLMKQPGILFSLFGVVLIIWFEVKTFKVLADSRALGFKRPKFDWNRCGRRLLFYILGVALPFVLLCFFLLCAGTFHQFWFWIVTSTGAYGSEVAGSAGFDKLLNQFTVHSGVDVLLWILGAIGLLIMLFQPRAGDRRPILLTLLVLSLLAVCPGLHFRQHYFVLALPAISLLVAYAFNFVIQLIKQAKFSPGVHAIPAAVLALIFLGFFLEGREQQVLFKDTPAAACRDLFGTQNPFVESPEIARYITEHTSRNDSIAILGSEPQICFYAHRRSVTGYIYTYGLMDIGPLAQHMQNEMIREIETGKPQMLVFVNLPLSWLAEAKSERTIFDWLEKYCRDFYDVVGTIDFPDAGASEAHWGSDAANFDIHRDNCVFIMKRRPAG